jgi:ribonuclease Z
VIRVTFLGTAASRPTVSRNVSGLVVQRGGELLLFDCGEGTQRQMMRFGTGFGVNDVFFTHLHADHFLGITGLLRTMGLQDRTEMMRLWGPVGSAAILEQTVHLGVERVPFPVEIAELEAYQRVGRDGYDVVAYPTMHGTRTLGYALIEHERLGRFDVARARALGIPEGPLFGQLHKGMSVQYGDRTITSAEVVGPPRPGRRIVYSGDTRPCRATVEVAAAADLLVHDATFGTEESERARATGHATAAEAADTARRAGVRRLALTHLSARYADDARSLEREARELFPNALVAYDGLTIEVPFPDADVE